MREQSFLAYEPEDCYWLARKRRALMRLEVTGEVDLDRLKC